eukprot:GHVO01016184.1.p1 GENE.GHVO01016184.1~~GHVO01016184.1.p1  ORF type:complete len:231 (-),score=9.05 GHVO01016184.1:110-724(-)
MPNVRFDVPEVPEVKSEGLWSPITKDTQSLMPSQKDLPNVASWSLSLRPYLQEPWKARLKVPVRRIPPPQDYPLRNPVQREERPDEPKPEIDIKPVESKIDQIAEDFMNRLVEPVSPPPEPAEPAEPAPHHHHHHPHMHFPHRHICQPIPPPVKHVHASQRKWCCGASKPRVPKERQFEVDVTLPIHMPFVARHRRKKKPPTGD